MKTLIGVCVAALALTGSSCMGNAKQTEAVSAENTDSLYYLLVGSYAQPQEEGIRVYVFNQDFESFVSYSFSRWKSGVCSR